MHSGKDWMFEQEHSDCVDIKKLFDTEHEAEHAVQYPMTSAAAPYITNALHWLLLLPLSNRCSAPYEEGEILEVNTSQ